METVPDETAININDEVLTKWLSELALAWRPLFLNLKRPYRSLDLEDIFYRFNPKMRSRAGVYLHHSRKIELNPILIKSKDFLEDVLVHELCHAVVCSTWPFAESHGRKWKGLMTLLGKNPAACHKELVPNRRTHQRFEAFCGCRTHAVTTRLKNRLVAGHVYRCNKCLSRVSLGLSI